MTLIELLLALAVAVVVILLVFSVYRTISGAAEGQQERRRTRYAAQDAAERFARDATCLFAPEPADAWAVTLRPREDRTNLTAECSFCLWREGPAPGPPLVRVSYRLEDQTGRWQLVRAEWPARGPAVTNTEVLLERVGRFQIALRDDAAWRTTWPAGENTAPPQAARLEVAAAESSAAHGAATEVWIPAGAVFTSRLHRAPAGK